MPRRICLWRAIRALMVASLLLPLTAQAWNPAGHRLSALIAWQQLDEDTHRGIDDLLAQHPDYKRWIARGKELAPELAAFLEASTWPDDIKGDKRFYDAGEENPTALLPGFPDMAKHREWHYVDRPIAPSTGKTRSNGVLDRQLKALIETLGDEHSNKQQRAYALPWLIHLVADAHQPLHAASRYDAQGHSDEGGNLLIVEHPFHPRFASMSLHAYWDDLAGPPWLRGAALERTAQAIVAAYPPPAPPGNPERWLTESWEIARTIAYPAGDETRPQISEAFNALAQSTAQRRIAEAGYRLADLLKTFFSEKRIIAPSRAND